MKKIVFLVLMGFWGLGTEGWGQSCYSINFPNPQTPALDCNLPVGEYTIANSVKRSIVFIQFNNIVGSGFLINTTSPYSNDVYLLTASHVLSTTSQAQSSLFVFGYEGNLDTSVYAIRGADANVEVVATASNLDFTLIRLSRTRLPNCYKSFYSGWNISTNILSSVFGIHHPAGDDKKISFSDRQPTTTTGYKNANILGITLPISIAYQSQSHWKVVWNSNNVTVNKGGTVQKGSSGSPLFDSNKRVIGIASSKSSGLCELDYVAYQKINKTWSLVKQYLDFENSNLLKIDGYDPYNLQWTAENSYESNNTISTAEDVFPMITPQFKGFLRSYIQTTTDKDYFRLNVTGQGNLKLKLTNLPQNYNLKLVNTLGEVIAQSNNSGTSDEIINYSIIDGTRVYALIEGTGTTASTTPYKLEVEFLPCSDPFEPNEWYNQANNTAFPQNLGNNPIINRIIQAPISDSDDEDWYAIGVDATGTLTLDLTDLPYDCNLQLYGLNGNLLLTSATNGLVNERVSRLHNQLQSTIYYARVYRVTNQFSICDPYTLKLNWQPSTACTAPTPSVRTTAESAAGARNGAVTLTVTGGATPYTFIWNNGATTQNLSNLSGGNYRVTITTADGCRATSSAIVATTGSIAPYCDAITTLTSNSGSFDDGSGALDYAPFSDCRWLIQPTNAQNITLNFNSFTLGTGDKIFVYDGNSTSAPLIGEFSTSRLPSPIVSSGGSLYVRFSTDATLQVAGWSARYSTTLIQQAEKLIGYEYWFDDNSTNRVSRFFTPISSRLLDTKVNTDGLNYGLHTLHFRTIDENSVYSSVISQMFTKQPPRETTAEMVYWEYWFDDNYNDRSVEGFPYGSTLAIDDYVLPPDSLRVGLHTLNARFQDINGDWSSVISHLFYKSTPSVSDNKITNYRFWYDNSPQNMRTIVVSPPKDIVSLDSLIDVSGLGVGQHLIHFQHQDLNKNWSSVVTDTFNVFFQPAARFGYQNVSCTNGQVQFTNNSTNATTYLWRFGNGLTSTAAAPTHTYTSAGTYEVTLISSNGGGFKDSIKQTITVTNTTVTAMITPSNSVTICQKDSVLLTASGGTIYRWSTGETTPSVWIKQTGNYSITITNPSGCTGTVSRSVTVVARPTVDFGFTIQGGKVTLNNLSSGATSYLWRFGNDTTSTVVSPIANYRTNGLYKICLVATNSQNCKDSICKEVNITRVAVQELPEGLNFKVSPNPTRGIIEVNLNFYRPFQNNERLTVTDILGRQVAELKQIKESNSFDITNLASGTYLLRLALNGKMYTLEKIIKSD